MLLACGVLNASGNNISAICGKASRRDNSMAGINCERVDANSAKVLLSKPFLCLCCSSDLEH